MTPRAAEMGTNRMQKIHILYILFNDLVALHACPRGKEQQGRMAARRKSYQLSINNKFIYNLRTAESLLCSRRAKKPRC